MNDLIKTGNVRLIACPKPFKNPSEEYLQHTIIEFWLDWLPKSKLTLVANEDTVALFAKSKNINFLKCEINNFDTPLLESLLKTVEDRSDEEYIIYVNSDIVLFQDIKGVLKSSLID